MKTKTLQAFLKGENMIGGEMFSNYLVCSGGMKFILLQYVAETNFLGLPNLSIFYKKLDHDFYLPK